MTVMHSCEALEVLGPMPLVQLIVLGDLDLAFITFLYPSSVCIIVRQSRISFYFLVLWDHGFIVEL